MRIEIKEYTKIIRGATVLDNVSCSFESGKIHGLSGVNGSGKTMLMRAICGLIRPTHGTIMIDGKEETAIGKVGVLIETPSFLDGMTGYENLLMLARIQNCIGEDEIKNAICRLGLDPEDRRKYRKYSLGMKQRLGIAAAIMEDHPILLLDEPFNALDREGAELVKDLMAQLRAKDKIVVLSCHERNLLENLSDEIYEIENGRLV